MDGIREQINHSFDRVEDTEFAEVGEVRKDNLEGRLDYIVGQQAQYADNIEKSSLLSFG